MRRSNRLKDKQNLGQKGKAQAAGGDEGSQRKGVPEKAAEEKSLVVAVSSGEESARTNDNKGKELPSTSKAAAAKWDNKIDNKKRLRLSDPILDVDLILTPVSASENEPLINPFEMDHVIELIYSFIFPGSASENFNLQHLCNLRLVSKVWNTAGVRLLQKHCRIAVGRYVESGNASVQSVHSHAGEYKHDLDKELTLSLLPPITVNLPVEKIHQFACVLKNSVDVPFVMFSLRGELFTEENARAFLELLKVCGPFMQQLLVTMEPSTCTMSFSTPDFKLNKLQQFKIMMQHPQIEVEPTASMGRQTQAFNFLQALCNETVALDRLEIHWLQYLIPWPLSLSLTLSLPNTITKLTVDFNTDATTVKSLLLHNDLKLIILKWSIRQTADMSANDIKLCLDRHSKSLRSLYFSLWSYSNDKNALLKFPPMPNLEQLSLMGFDNQIIPFSFPEIFPKLSSFTLYYLQMNDLMSEVKASKSVKEVRILGAPIPRDFPNTLAKTFLELETLIVFLQNDLPSKDYLVSMFDLMPKLRILLVHISRSDATSETSNIASEEEDWPNGLYMRSFQGSTCIVRIESGSTDVSQVVAEALENLDLIPRNPPSRLGYAYFKHLYNWTKWVPKSYINLYA